MKRVLVVDDNKANIHLVRFILRKTATRLLRRETVSKV